MKRKSEQSSPSKRQKLHPSLGDPNRDYIRETLLSDQFFAFMTYIYIGDIWALAWTCQTIYQRIRTFTETRLLDFVHSSRPYNNTLCLHGPSSNWDSRSSDEKFKYNIRFVLYLRSRKLIGADVCEQTILKIANVKTIRFYYIFGLGCDLSLIEKLHSLRQLSFSRNEQNGSIVYSSFPFSAKYLISVTKEVATGVARSRIIEILDYCKAIWQQDLIKRYFEYLEFLLDNYPESEVVLGIISKNYRSGLSIEQLKTLFRSRTSETQVLYWRDIKSEDLLFAAAETGRLYLPAVFSSVLLSPLDNLLAIRMMFRSRMYCHFYSTCGKDLDSKKKIIEIAKLYKTEPSYGLEEFDEFGKLVLKDPTAKSIKQLL